MRTIWKYEVQPTDRFSHEIPRGFMFLDVQMQQGRPQLWALVDTEKPMERVDFALVGTGNSYPDADEGEFWHVGSFQLHEGALVFHLFYRDPLAGLDSTVGL